MSAEIQRFRNRLCILMSIDRDELEQARVDDAVIIRFMADPYRTFIRASDKNRERIWDVVEKREIQQ